MARTKKRARAGTSAWERGRVARREHVPEDVADIARMFDYGGDWNEGRTDGWMKAFEYDSSGGDLTPNIVHYARPKDPSTRVTATKTPAGLNSTTLQDDLRAKRNLDKYEHRIVIRGNRGVGADKNATFYEVPLKKDATAMAESSEYIQGVKSRLDSLIRPIQEAGGDVTLAGHSLGGFAARTLAPQYDLGQGEVHLYNPHIMPYHQFEESKSPVNWHIIDSDHLNHTYAMGSAPTEFENETHNVYPPREGAHAMEHHGTSSFDGPRAGPRDSWARHVRSKFEQSVEEFGGAPAAEEGAAVLGDAARALGPLGAVAGTSLAVYKDLANGQKLEAAKDAVEGGALAAGGAFGLPGLAAGVAVAGATELGYRVFRRSRRTKDDDDDEVSYHQDGMHMAYGSSGAGREDARDAHLRG